MESLRRDIKTYYKKGISDKENSETPVLDEFGRDLTALAKEGKLDPVVGRQDEIIRLLQILGRRQKNNAVLIDSVSRNGCISCRHKIPRSV